MLPDPVPGRLRWRCRRGMRELDVVLERWLASHYATADAARREAFGRLLDAPDPQLLAWLFGRERPTDPGVAGIIDDLLASRE